MILWRQKPSSTDNHTKSPAFCVMECLWDIWKGLGKSETRSSIVYMQISKSESTDCILVRYACVQCRLVGNETAHYETVHY